VIGVWNETLPWMFCLNCLTFPYMPVVNWSQDSTISLAESIQWLGYRLHDPWFKFQQGQEIFLVSKMSRQALGLTQLHIQCILVALSWGVKQPGHEAGHSPLCCARLRICGTIPLLPLYVCMLCVGTTSHFLFLPVNLFLVEVILGSYCKKRIFSEFDQ